jgi:hypothetical protein
MVFKKIKINNLKSVFQRQGQLKIKKSQEKISHEWAEWRLKLRNSSKFSLKIKRIRQNQLKIVQYLNHEVGLTSRGKQTKKIDIWYLIYFLA